MAESHHTATSSRDINRSYSIQKEEEDRSEDVVSHLADPFGDEEFAEIKYRTLQWWQCGMIMIAETVSLGILSLPSAVAVLGLATYVFYYFQLMSSMTTY
jgi:hypothetical protein